MAAMQKKDNIDLSVKIGKMTLSNPVMVASGTFGYAQEFAPFIDLKKLGAIVTKTITIKPRQGNPAPRTCETPAGLINSIGLENPGVDSFIAEKLPPLFAYKVPIVVSIASEGDPEEFVALARRFEKIREVSALEINISCPNVKHKVAAGRKLIAQDASMTGEIVRLVRSATKKALITKLSPNVTDITEIAQAAVEAGTDALALINTVSGMSVDIDKRTSRIAMVSGGLSGPAIRPIAVRMVWEVYSKIKVPIIGMGGICDTSSALEFLIAGASSVSIGTANFVDPAVSIEVIRGIQAYLRKNSMASVRELIGSLKV